MKLVAGLLLALSLAAQSYKIRTDTGVIELSSEEYVAGVVAGESGELDSAEALKAMAVAARSYAARMQGRHANEGFDFCTTTHCQRYVKPQARALEAARETAGETLWFEGKPAFAPYSRSCGGVTENAAAVWPDMAAPYLASHVDPYCSSGWSWSGSAAQIHDALTRAGLKSPAEIRDISIVRRTASGRAQTLSLDGVLLSASSLRFAVGRAIAWSAIRSEKYSIEKTADGFLFRGSGEGHGVGLCQMGADRMGAQGRNYREILAFYYPGTSVKAGAPPLKWSTLSGEGIALYSLHPDADREVLLVAESVVSRWRGKLPWPVPPQIDIYAYPDLDAFRNSTGEPGWVAARTRGAKIELQPVAVLKSHNALAGTLEHELVHSFIEYRARTGLPVWFREGLVEQLTSKSLTGAAITPNDRDLQQRNNRAAAEQGYRQAAARVRDLINRYGETTVLTWVERGLPAEVTNSNASNPPVNKK